MSDPSPIEATVTACIAHIDARHAVREQAITTSRQLVRRCALAIRATHRGQYSQADQLITEAGQLAIDLNQCVSTQPMLMGAGYVQDGLKEYVEASLVYAFLTGGALPTPKQLNVDCTTYLNGLAEAASELRRAILDRLRGGAGGEQVEQVTQVESLLTIMDDVYSVLITVDYPEALTSGLRRTTDALRAVLERTRGDVTNAIRQERLSAALAELEGRLKR